MKITFEPGLPDGTDKSKAENPGTKYYRNQAAGRPGAGRGCAAYEADLYGDRGFIRERYGDTGNGRTAQDISRQAQCTDVSALQDYMTVASHTMSAEDYARMEEEGFHFENLDPETAVTILDKIKAELILAGQQIAGYTDTLDFDTLAEAVGSPELARRLQQIFSEEDLPLTRENVNGVMQAAGMAESMNRPTDGEYRYMVDNGMEPDIGSFYLAHSSGAGSGYAGAEEAGSAAVRGAGSQGGASGSHREGRSGVNHSRKGSAVNAAGGKGGGAAGAGGADKPAGSSMYGTPGAAGSGSAENFRKETGAASGVSPDGYGKDQRGQALAGTRPSGETGLDGAGAGKTVGEYGSAGPGKRRAASEDNSAGAVPAAAVSAPIVSAAAASAPIGPTSAASAPIVPASAASASAVPAPIVSASAVPAPIVSAAASSTPAVPAAAGGGYAQGRPNRAPSYFADDIDGYYSRAAASGGTEAIRGQIDQVILRAGLEATQETREAASWLLDQGLPLTEKTLNSLLELEGVSFPVSTEQAVTAAVRAAAAGQSPLRGRLDGQENIYRRAQQLTERFFTMELPDSAQLAARRQLEEVRLRMTAEVNVKLLRSGFSIDTAPMEELIEALKQAERQVACDYFPGESGEQALSKYRLYREAEAAASELPGYPAAVLGSWSLREQEGTFGEFCHEGRTLRDTCRRAEESYEALMTAPRSDMGDSMSKAFSNVDEILEDLGYENTERNRKAVRILGYNRMELTPENIDRVKNAYRTVANVAERMTPGAVLQMIRDGVNPLEKSMEELNEYFDMAERPYEESSEGCAEFLYHLERNGEISQEERDSYVGIYRLLHQVERADGAAVGLVVDSGAALSFSNLLTAARTRRTKMDVKVDDAFGALSELSAKGISITEQISQGYGNEWNKVLTYMSQTGDTGQDYLQEELSRIRAAGISDEECAKLLSRGQLPGNTENLLAAQALVDGKGAPFVKWQRFMERSGKQTTLMSQSAGLCGETGSGSEFREEYAQMLDAMEDGVEERTMEAGTHMEVRELQLLHKQLSVAGCLARRNEEYLVPLYVGEELTTVHLTLVQGQEHKGQVRASLELEELGHIEGSFGLENGRLGGYFTADKPETVTKLRAAADIFTVRASEEWEVDPISVIQTDAPVRDLPQGEGTADDALYRVAKHFLNAVRTLKA